MLPEPDHPRVKGSPVVSIEDYQRACVVVLQGDLDHDDQDLLRLTMRTARLSGKQVIIDLSRVSFLDVATVGTLLRAGNAPLCLAGPLALNPQRVLALTWTEGVFRVFPSLADALVEPWLISLHPPHRGHSDN
ncbi:STAS domain-containing protein [Streptomyces angustmyceticus]